MSITIPNVIVPIETPWDCCWCYKDNLEIENVFWMIVERLVLGTTSKIDFSKIKTHTHDKLKAIGYVGRLFLPQGCVY